MDFNQLEPKQTAFCHLKHPKTGELLFDEQSANGPIPVGVEVHGPDSEKFLLRQRAAANEALHRGRAKQKRVEDIEQEGLDFLVAITESIQGIAVDGRELPSDAGHVRGLYVRFRWIREQVDAFATNRANFFKG